ncbi:CsbD family protein [Aquipuribacter nitratireducens]|uniref:CsbD family protein n=1 Tax=Aquipuribacter nitratireducens TaxID=650104 RepID=A0ABW0GPW1_9MICO
MADSEKTENTIDKMAGKAKEGLGRVNDDESMEREGKRDQSEADLKQAGEKAKDAFRR